MAYLAGLAKFGMVPTLDRIEALLQALGRPHTRYPVVHVAGTNGKGSTCRMVANALTQSGLRTGMFISPHLIRYNERICVDGRPIADADLLGLIEQVRQLTPSIASRIGHPTEFEMSTAMAFLHFAQANVDVAVIEVGMGGLWDSTNVVQPLVSVITPVSMDHMNRLGNTLGEIAGQKAGIIKPGVPVVCGPQPPEAAAVIAAKAAEMNSPVYWVTAQTTGLPDYGHTVLYEPVAWNAQGGSLHLAGPVEQWRDLHISLLGRHQLENGAVAATTCQLLTQNGVPVGEGDVREAFAVTTWPGRLEVLEREPLLLLDGAHNAAGAQVLRSALHDLFPQYRKTLVLGMLAEKQVAEVLAVLLPEADTLVCTAPAGGRTPPLAPAALAAQARSVADRLGLAKLRIVVQSGAWEALMWAKAQVSSDAMVCLCGSLYMVGEVRGRWETAQGLNA